MINISRREVLQLLGMAAAGATMGAAPVKKMEIPRIGLGTWQTFDVGDSRAARSSLEALLRTFVELGGTLVDSSPMYGTAEEVLGDVATSVGVHSKLFLATKVWTSGKRAGVKQMEDSMRKLRTKKLDLMQVHNLVDVDAHLDTLAAWKREGRVRHAGITHWTAGAHEEVARVITRRPVDFVQINYSVAEREAERRLLPLCKERGVAVIANRPFASGDLFRRLRDKPLPAWASEIDCTSWAQLLLKFVISHPSITVAIPATSKIAHLEDNMAAGRGRMPDEKMRARIAAAI